MSLFAGRNWNITTERLDSAYGWLPWPDTLPLSHLGLLAHPCANPQNLTLEGEVALALLPDDWTESQPCSLAEIVRNAQVMMAPATLALAKALQPDDHVVVCAHAS